MMTLPRAIALLLFAAIAAPAQVYSPKVLKRHQPDPTDLRLMARGIFGHADAHSPRERAEAIWRYFLTDGRFVKPGFWYHIAGWAYEDPMGEVLDPVKLMNSYGFGLCYQIAPVLEALWRAGGFEDARVWFLTGHTVAEVFYDGAYHYFDSDMLGYNTLGTGPANRSTVASVRQLERDPTIITSKLKAPREAASDPWYPADVRANAIDGLAELFTTTSDNSLFPFERAPGGHSMDFTLQPGDKLVRFFAPETEGLYYLPYKRTATGWEEFPREIAEYQIRTNDGPRSQKDARLWGTGRLESRLPLRNAVEQTHEIRSPYVIIDAAFTLDADLPSTTDTVTLTVSVDDGRTWSGAGTLSGPHHGPWKTEPRVELSTDHGRRTAVSGRYQYRIKLIRTGAAKLNQLAAATRVQLNPRTLPELVPGVNEMVYNAAPSPATRHDLAVDSEHVRDYAARVEKARWIGDGSQGYWIPDRANAAADFFFRIPASKLTAIHAGGRFLDLSRGLAPDKFTAEVRTVTPLTARNPAASIAWSTSPQGPFSILWQYDPNLAWKDGDKVERTLLWPEVDRVFSVKTSGDVWIRYRVRDLAIDDFRLATIHTAPVGKKSSLLITHQWTENGVAKSRTVSIPPGALEFRYNLNIPTDVQVVNRAVSFECR